MNKTENVLLKLRNIAQKNYNNGRYETAVTAISALGAIEYKYNQHYKDDFSEEILEKVSKKLELNITHGKDDKTVLFYDGFGVDVRGLVLIYLKALVKLNYNIIYITAAQDKTKQPQVMKLLQDNKVFLSPKQNKINRIKWLISIINQSDFNTAFFYTTPWDTEATIVFDKLNGTCTRYQIDLTDHTFWLGVNAFDYCIEFRDYGASNAYYERNIPIDKLLELPYYPNIDKETKFQGFPFDATGKKIIFSGGALYKTIDNELGFYRVIEYIVSKYDDVIFLYAGSGDSTHIMEAVQKFPGKVYYIAERNDLYQLLKHCYFFLNTYPISGALMLQYAAIAGCVPVTIKRPWDDDPEGILLHQEELAETFVDFESLYAEIDRLLDDENYIDKKRQLLSKMVIDEETFTSRLENILNNPKTPYNRDLKHYDTSLWKKASREIITINDIIDYIINKTTKDIYKYFPEYVIRKCISRFFP